MTGAPGSKEKSVADDATGATAATVDFADSVVEAAAGGSPDQAWKILSLVNDWIKHAETKAAATVATSGVAAGVLYNLLKGISDPGKSIWIPAAFCVALLLAAGLAAAWSLLPRLWSREEPTSNLYFDHIAKRHSKKTGSREFSETVRALSAADYELVGEIAGQIWANAHVARTKYQWANVGLFALLVGLVALGATTLAVAVAGG